MKQFHLSIDVEQFLFDIYSNDIHKPFCELEINKLKGTLETKVFGFTSYIDVQNACIKNIKQEKY